MKAVKKLTTEEGKKIAKLLYQWNIILTLQYSPIGGFQLL